MLTSSDKKPDKKTKISNIRKKIIISAWTILALAGELWAALTMVDRSDDLGIYRLISGKGCLITPDTTYFLTAFTILMLFVLVMLIYKFSHIIDASLSKNCPHILRRLIMNYLPASTIIICAIVFSLLLKNDVFGKLFSEYRIAHLRNDAAIEKFVIHAGGNLYDGDTVYSCTNSAEALENCYNYGHTFVEIDFLWTSDGKLVCAHNEDSDWAKGYDFETAPTLQEFLEQKYMGKYTSMDLDHLASFMRQHPDLKVIGDVKSNLLDACAYIAANHPDLTDRFIMQIYHISEYSTVRSLGFENIIYTLYKAEEYEMSPATLIENTRQYDLVAITFKYNYLNNNPFYYGLTEGVRLPLFVHTINDPAQVANAFGKGVFVYTDVCDTSIYENNGTLD